MTETMQDIRRRMHTIESTQHITHAMRLVSASKFRKAKKQFDQISRQLNQTMQIMEKLLAGQKPCLQTADKNRRILILFTSSRGLCGSYNSSLIKAAAAVSSQGDLFCTVGSRGEEFFRRQGYEMLYCLGEGPEKLRPDDAEEAARLILEEWKRGQTAEVLIIKMRYVNALKQEPRVRRILPMDRAEREEEKDLLPDDLEFLPSKEQVMTCLLPKYLQLVLWKDAVEAAVCEHVARRAAMEAASESASEMLEHLSQSYHRMRQQAITDELIEIVSGAESLK